MLNDVPHQAAAAESFIEKYRCYITDLVIAETVFVLEKVYRMPRQTVIALVTKLLKLKTVIYNEVLVEATFELFGKAAQLSFVDCYSAVEARLYENDLVTFDKHLLKKGGSHVRELK